MNESEYYYLNDYSNRNVGSSFYPNRINLTIFINCNKYFIQFSPTHGF